MWENFAPACRLLQRAVGKESLQEVIDVHGTIPYLDMHYKSAHLCVDHEKTREICKQFLIRYFGILFEPNIVHDIIYYDYSMICSAYAGLDFRLLCEPIAVIHKIFDLIIAIINKLPID